MNQFTRLSLFGLILLMAACGDKKGGSDSPFPDPPAGPGIAALFDSWTLKMTITETTCPDQYPVDKSIWQQITVIPAGDECTIGMESELDDVYFEGNHTINLSEGGVTYGGAMTTSCKAGGPEMVLTVGGDVTIAAAGLNCGPYSGENTIKLTYDDTGEKLTGEFVSTVLAIDYSAVTNEKKCPPTISCTLKGTVDTVTGLSGGIGMPEVELDPNDNAIDSLEEVAPALDVNGKDGMDGKDLECIKEIALAALNEEDSPECAAETVTGQLPGDMNCDGTVNVSDVAIATTMITNLEKFCGDLKDPQECLPLLLSDKIDPDGNGIVDACEAIVP